MTTKLGMSITPTFGLPYGFELREEEDVVFLYKGDSLVDRFTSNADITKILESANQAAEASIRFEVKKELFKKIDETIEKLREIRTSVLNYQYGNNLSADAMVVSLEARELHGMIMDAEGEQ